MSDKSDTKDVYVAKAKAQLDQLSTQIDELTVKANLAKADAKVKYQKQLTVLKSKQAAAKSRFEELQATAGNAWEEMQVGVEAAWKELQTAFDRAKSELDSSD